MILDKQSEHGWGKSIVENLAKDLQEEYKGIKGFSSGNLWRMRNFYQQYSNNQKLAPLVREISWVKNIIIMEKCKDDSEREFYIRITKKLGWTKDVLINQIENKSYEKYLSNQTNFDKTLPEKYKIQAKLAIKDEYTFGFLELGEEHSERELEKSLTEKIKHFLTEIGGYFCFVGSQYRIEIHDEEYFIDLLLYHRKLKCLVALELKIGDFKPEYASYKERQREIFLEQLDLAKELDLPVIFHCRMAHDELIDLLKGYGAIKGAIHCFTGDQEQAEEYLKMGLYLGFNGIIFKMDLDKVIEKSPLDRILLETDCPYLTSPPKVGRNEPLYVKYVADKISKIKNIKIEELNDITTQNAKKLFKI